MRELGLSECPMARRRSPRRGPRLGRARTSPSVSRSPRRRASCHRIRPTPLAERVNSEAGRVENAGGAVPTLEGMKHHLLIPALLASVASTCPALTEPEAAPTDVKFHPKAASLAVNAGLLQPIVLGGANLEADFRIGPFVAAYSHGWSLDLEGGAIVGDMKRQGVTLHLPYSTGFGVGLTHWVSGLSSFFDLRFEGEIHRFEASYASADGLGKTEIARYSTYTLGAGAYWTYMPFASREGALGGIDISASVRLWPNVASTLSGNEVAYRNATTGRDEVHRAAKIGIADTSVIVNVSVGYVFQ